MSDSLWKITWPTCSSTESSTSTTARITSPGNGEAETMPRRVNFRWPKGTQKALNYEITWHLYLKLVTLELHLQVVAYLGEPGSAQNLRSFCYVSQPRPQPPCFASVSCNEDRLCFQIWRMKGSSNTFLPFPSFPQSLHQLIAVSQIQLRTAKAPFSHALLGNAVALHIKTLAPKIHEPCQQCLGAYIPVPSPCLTCQMSAQAWYWWKSQQYRTLTRKVAPWFSVVFCVDFFLLLRISSADYAEKCCRLYLLVWLGAPSNWYLRKVNKGQTWANYKRKKRQKKHQNNRDCNTRTQRWGRQEGSKLLWGWRSMRKDGRSKGGKASKQDED